jgi:uncharacterized protein with HEPN domain
MELQDFTVNEQVILAVKYALLIVSEAVVKLGDLTSDLCPDIPWREIRGLRNRLRHDYQRIDGVRVWLLIKRDPPPLKIACRALDALAVSAAGGADLFKGRQFVEIDEGMIDPPGFHRTIYSTNHQQILAEYIVRLRSRSRACELRQCRTRSACAVMCPF